MALMPTDPNNPGKPIPIANYTAVQLAEFKAALDRSRLDYPAIAQPRFPVGQPPNTIAYTFLTAGPFDDWGPPGWVGGFTNRLMLTPAAGGTTLGSLDATNVPDGFEVEIFVDSATDYLFIPNLSPTAVHPQNQVQCYPAGVSLAPQTGAVLKYNATVNNWTFA